jgi:hypothetical protein
MKNAALPLLAIALVFGAVAWFLFGQPDDKLNTDIDTGSATTAEGGTELVAVEASSEKKHEDRAPTREALAGNEDDADEDPLISRAMAGFRGRLVLASGKPAADKPVRFFRLDPELLQNPHLFAKEPVIKPELETYESRSAEDGTFTVTGVWPQVFYLLVADVDGEHQSTRLVEKTPGAGEVIDLGDILLADLGTISGRVVDMDGNPAANALVRAMDLPTMILDAAPIQRFDPEGGLIVDEHGFKTIMTMPPWVRTVFDKLPIPTTHTDSAGAFVVRGVAPGTNAVLVNYPDHVALVKKGVRVKAGKEKKVGKLSLAEGEIAQGKVVDTADNPIAGVEVMIATRHPAIPVHFGSFTKPTDEKGQFELSGLSPGPVYAAVRRSRDEAWTLHGPASVGGDLVVKLPKMVSLTLRVKTTSGAPAENVRFKVVASPGENGPGLDLASIGLMPWIDMKKRVEKQDDGRYRLHDLMPGDYSMAIQAAGHAPARLNISLKADTERDVVLPQAVGLEVLVVDGDRKPIRNVKIYTTIRGVNPGSRVQNIPVLSGKTNREGRVVVTDGQAGSVRLSASHPAYGSYHKQLELPTKGPYVIKMLEAGVITGLLLDGGKPPKPGKWTITIEKSWQENRGAMPSTPRLVVADLEGKFRVNGLAPGKYRVSCMPSLALVGSPGGIVAMANSSNYGSQREETQVTSGGESFVQLDASGKREVTGPSAAVTGTVMINSRPATGMIITGWSQSGRIHAEVDEAGRFDVGRLGVGWFDLQLKRAPNAQAGSVDAFDGQMWRQNGQIKENEDLQFDLILNTGSIAGMITLADGSPASSVEVVASGSISPMPDKPKSRSQARVTTFTDEFGRFGFKKVVAGDYHIRVRAASGYGRTPKLVVQGGLPLTDVMLKLQKVYTLKGKVDVSVYPKKVDYMYIQFTGAGESRGTRVGSETGEFRMTGLPRGEYKVQISCWGSTSADYRTASGGQPVLLNRDIKDLKITPVFKKRKPRKSGKLP